MRNKTLYFLIICFFFSVNISLAQCTQPGYILPDTVCPNKPFTISNQSPALYFNWDNGLGDLDSIPTAALLPAVSGTLTYPENMKLVFENGNYYGFVPNALASYITKYEFGNSLNNNPIITNLPSDASLSTFQSAIEAVKENGKWFLFVSMYSSNSIVKVEMDSINQSSNLTFTNIPISGLNNPWSIKIINHVGFLMNNQDDKLIRIDFNGSYDNTPSLVTPSVSTGCFNNFGFDIAYDCASNSYYGIGTSFSAGNAFRYNFGNSLLNTPTLSNIITGVSGLQGVQLMQENGVWHLFMVSNTNNFYNYSLGNSLSNSPALLYSNSLNGIFADPKNIQLVKEGSSWIGLISSTSLFNVVRIKFPDANIYNNQYSNLSNPNNISFSPNALGYQRIEYREYFENGISNVYLDSVYVNIAPPKAKFITTNLCINDSVSFFDSTEICFGNITNWNWSFGDGGTSTDQNPKHLYASSGNFNVTLSITDNFNNTSSYTSLITVRQKPTADFSFVNNSCSGSPVLFNDNSLSADGNITSWSWTINNNNYNNSQASVIFNTTGNYLASLLVTTEFGCVDTISKQVSIEPAPIADFSISNSCIGEVALFNNLTDSNATAAVNYQWNFGDSNSSSLTNPSNTYPTTASLYNVSLIATATNGCADTIQKIIRIGNKPQPWFTTSADTVCQFAAIQFSDSSFAGIGDIITNRYWDLGDGTVLKDSLSLIHYYSTPGLYQISLTVKSPTDCDSTIVRNIYVISSPTAIFTVSNVCEGLPNVFNDFSTSPAGSLITSWTLNFGDNNFSNNPNTNHVYTSYGNYNTSLIVVSSKGCSDTSYVNAQVFPLPAANFSSGKACTGKSIQFTDSSSVIIGSISNWDWTFGNGIGNSNLQNPLFTFNNNFAYPVQLICYSNNGCKDSVTKFIIVDKTPSFTINANDICEGLFNQFGYTLNSSASTSLAYLWSFGDSTTSFQPSPSHLYAATGAYPISLEITDLTNGCSLVNRDTITIHPNPVADFNYSDVCIEKDIDLIEACSISNGSILSYQWNFNNQIVFGDTVIYNNNQTGSYNISLVASSDFGCKDTISKTINVYPNPTVNFSADVIYGAPPLLVNFTNLSSIGNFQWNFNDGSLISTLVNPSHLFTDTGSFDVMLYAVSPFGCIDSNTATISVFEPINDIAVIGNSVTRDNNKWVLKALFKNEGNLTITNAEIKISLDGRSSVYENVTGITIAPGNILEYEFKTSFDAGDYSPSYYCTEAINVNQTNDLNNSNNLYCSTISDKFDCYNLYPNPASDFVNFGVTIPEDGYVDMRLFAESGSECILNSTNYLKSGYSLINFDLSKIASGSYFISVKYKEELKTLKFIKH